MKVPALGADTSRPPISHSHSPTHTQSPHVSLPVALCHLHTLLLLVHQCVNIYSVLSFHLLIRFEQCQSVAMVKIVAWKGAVGPVLCAPLPDSAQVCKYLSGIWKMGESQAGAQMFRALIDVRGGCHWLYPECPFIGGSTFTSDPSIFILSSNSLLSFG